MITLILGISVDAIVKEEGMNSHVLGQTIFLMFCSLLTLVQVLTRHLT